MVHENRYAVPTGEQLKVMILDKLNVTAHSEIKIRLRLKFSNFYLISKLQIGIKMN